MESEELFDSLVADSIESYIKKAARLGTDEEYHERIVDLINDRKVLLFERGEDVVKEWYEFMCKIVQ